MRRFRIQVSKARSFIEIVSCEAHRDSLPAIIARVGPNGRPAVGARVWALRWRKRWFARLGFLGTADALPASELRQKARLGF